MSKYTEGQKRATRAYIKRQRERTLALMGNKCARCGFTDSRALQIDHVNGGGCKDKKGSPLYNRLIKLAAMGNLADYQLLCANCNWIKRAENDENRGSLARKWEDAASKYISTTRPPYGGQ